MATVTGVLVDDGKDVGLEKILNNVNTNRTTIKMGLFVNAAGLVSTSVLATIEPLTESNGYAPVTLTDGSWSLASNGSGLGYTASFAQQVFTASGGSFQEGGGDASVTGWYLYTTGTAAKLIAFCYSGGSQVVVVGASIKVTPSVKLEDGTNGVVSDEGTQMMLDSFLNDVSDYNSTNVYIGLDTNSTALTTTSVYAGIAAPTSAGGYAIKNPAFTVSGGSATTVLNEFDASGAAFSSPIYAYTITSTGGSGSKLLAYDAGVGNITVADGDSYDVTIAI